MSDTQHSPSSAPENEGHLESLLPQESLTGEWPPGTRDSWLHRSPYWLSALVRLSRQREHTTTPHEQVSRCVAALSLWKHFLTQIILSLCFLPFVPHLGTNRLLDYQEGKIGLWGSMLHISLWMNGKLSTCGHVHRHGAVLGIPCISCSERTPWCKCTPCTPAAVPLPPPQEPLIDVTFSPFPFIYTCEAWGPAMSWHLLITFLLALAIPGTRKRKVNRERGQLQTLFLLPCLVTSPRIASTGSAHLLLGWYFQGATSAFGGLCLVSPAVSLPLCLWAFECYPPPFSIYSFPHTHFAHSRLFFSVFPLGTGCGFRGKTFWLGMNLSIRKRTNRSTSC